MILLFFSLSLGAARAASYDGVWLTLGEPAYRLLQRIDPQTRIQASRAVEGSGALIGESKFVFVVQATLDERDALAAAVHTDLHHCGGFVAHDSMADALSWLEPPILGFIPTRPGYGIDQQVRVLPMLADVSDTRIGADIQSLWLFTTDITTAVMAPTKPTGW